MSKIYRWKKLHDPILRKRISLYLDIHTPGYDFPRIIVRSIRIFQDLNIPSK